MTETPSPAPHPVEASEDRTAFDWESRFAADNTPWERRTVHPALEHFQQAGRLEPGTSVIVPGCGRGLEPLHLARAGLTVTAADLSETAMAWQAERFAEADLEARLIEGDVLALRPDPVDRVWEQTFLCALHPRHREAYEQAVHAWLKPGGQLLALFMQKAERGGPPYGCDLASMRALFPADRWIWPDDADFLAFPHPNLGKKAELGGALTRR